MGAAALGCVKYTLSGWLGSAWPLTMMAGIWGDDIGDLHAGLVGAKGWFNVDRRR